MFKATVTVTLRKSILDPKGKAAEQALHQLGMHEIGGVRIGKHIVMDVNCNSEEKAHELVENACSKLLANEVMEDFHITIEKS